MKFLLDFKFILLNKNCLTVTTKCLLRLDLEIYFLNLILAFIGFNRSIIDFNLTPKILSCFI